MLTCQANYGKPVVHMPSTTKLDRDLPPPGWHESTVGTGCYVRVAQIYTPNEAWEDADKNAAPFVDEAVGQIVADLRKNGWCDATANFIERKYGMGR